MSTTTELRPTNCPRCETSFVPADGYHMLDLYDRPPGTDLHSGNTWDLHLTICRECHMGLLQWLYPNATSWDNLGERLRNEAVGADKRLTQ